MKLLFDTHAFIWWDSAPEKLPKEVLDLCEDPQNTLFLSVASVWEIQIKSRLDRLNLRLPLGELVVSQQERNQIKLLDISIAHVLQLEALPQIHKDPFDRILIAQALVEEIVLLSRDSYVRKYDVPIKWSH